MGLSKKDRRCLRILLSAMARKVVLLKYASNDGFGRECWIVGRGDDVGLQVFEGRDVIKTVYEVGGKKLIVIDRSHLNYAFVECNIFIDSLRQWGVDAEPLISSLLHKDDLRMETLLFMNATKVFQD